MFRATDEREVARECLDRARHAIPARAAQLDEILRRGKSDQEVSVVLKDTPNSAVFIRAVIDSTIENERSTYGTKRSALATIHSHPG